MAAGSRFTTVFAPVAALVATPVAASAVALAVAVATASTLAACDASNDRPKPAGAPGASGTAVSRSASLKDFCGDFLYVLALPAPDVGSSIPVVDIAAYDRAAAEAPAAVKADMAAADTAVHAAAAAATAEDLKRLSIAMQKVAGWALTPSDNCPSPSK